MGSLSLCLLRLVSELVGGSFPGEGAAVVHAVVGTALVIDSFCRVAEKTSAEAQSKSVCKKDNM